METTARSMGVGKNSVSYKDTEILSVNRMLNRLVDDEAQSHHRQLAVYKLKAITVVAIPLSSTTFINSTQLYHTLTNLLKDAVTTGEFTKTLQQVSASIGAVLVVNASVTGVSNTEPQIVAPQPTVPVSPEESTVDKLSNHQIMLIVIGGTTGLVVFLSWLYLKKMDYEHSMRYNPTIRKGMEIHL